MDTFDRTRLASAAVAFYLPTDPEKAKAIAEKESVVYDYYAQEYFLGFFASSPRDRTNRFINLRQVFDLVEDKETFLVFMASKLSKLDESTFRLLLTKIPELLLHHRDQVMDVIVFGLPLFFVVEKLKEHDIVITPQELNLYFNVHWQEKKLSDSRIGSLAWAISGEFNNKEEVSFSEEVWHYFRLAVVKQYEEKAFDDSFSHLFDSLTSDQKTDLVKIVINRFIVKKKYGEAADFAGAMEMRDLQIYAAYCAYERCMSRRQYREAAELALKYDIVDTKHAAKKELKRMKKLDDNGRGGPNKYKMVAWAVKFGLKLCEDQVYGYIPSDHTPENLLKIGCPGLARKEALHRLENSDFYGVAHKYFYPGNELFTEEESINAIAKGLIKWRLDGNMHLQFRDYGTKLLNQWDKQKMMNQFFIEWILLAPKEKEKLEDFLQICIAEQYASDTVTIDLPSLAEKAADLALEQGAWDKYKAICIRWFSVETQMELLRIDND